MTNKQKQFIQVFFENGSKKKSAKIVNVSEQTVQRWFKDESFIKELDLYQEKIISKNLDDLVLLMNKSNRTLNNILDDKKTTTNQKITVCKIIMDNVFKSIEIVEIKKRLDKLENIDY